MTLGRLDGSRPLRSSRPSCGRRQFNQVFGQRAYGRLLVQRIAYHLVLHRSAKLLHKMVAEGLFVIETHPLGHLVHDRREQV